MRFLLAAVEPSADAIGAAIMRALHDACPHAEFIGCGGAAMEAAGASIEAPTGARFKSTFNVDALSVMGFTDVAGVYFKAAGHARDLAMLARDSCIDAAVFIDGWAFSRLAATRFRRFAPDVKLFKVAAPQVWASRPQRVDFVRAYFDGVLCLLPFEPPWFERAGVRTRYVGNPNFQTAYRQRGDGAAFRQRHDLPADTPLLAILPGSRHTEFKRLAPIFERAAARLASGRPGFRVVAPLASALGPAARDAASGWPGEALIVGPEEKFDAFAAADFALAASGTVTTELAINGTPMVVAYRVDPLTAIWARRVMTARFASIINIAADAEILPEFIQEDCTPENLEGALRALLDDPAARARQRAGWAPVLEAFDLDGEPAAQRAASALLEWIA